MANVLLFPLHGAFLVIGLVLLVVKVWALVDSLIRPEPAYRAAGKQTKVFWVVILIVAVLLGNGFLNVLGLIAALVYLLDVRPAVKGIGKGGSSSGPYGPW